MKVSKGAFFSMIHWRYRLESDTVKKHPSPSLDFDYEAASHCLTLHYQDSLSTLRTAQFSGWASFLTHDRFIERDIGEDLKI
jgi:hypothetical protein